MPGEEQVGAHVRLTGDASGVAGAVNQANNAFAQLEQAVATNWWGLQNLGLAFSALPAAIAAGVGVAINFAKSWEDSMFEVRRTAGLMGEEAEGAFRTLEKSLLDVARVTPIATTELAALAAEGAALGIRNEDLDEFAKIMGVLVSSTNLTAESVDDVARVLNIMQVPVTEFENFSSALIDVGRNTAATETDMVSAAKRIATVASVAGASTTEVLGFSAALRSLGPNAEAGATAVTRTMSQMACAIADGGQEMSTFAQVSGMSREEFEQTFDQSGLQAVAAYVTGLGRLGPSLTEIQKALNLTGSDAVRQAQALATLANGTRDVGNAQRDTNAILDLTAQSYRENATAQQILEERQNTLTGQMQIFQNLVFETGQAFGNSLLPPIKVFIGFLGDVVSGIQVMNPVLRSVLLGGVLFAGALSAIAAALLLIGPRIIIAVGAMRQLRQAQQTASGGAAGLGAAQNSLAGATNRVSTAANFQVGVLRRVIGTQFDLTVATSQNSSAFNANTAAKQRNAQSTGFLRAIYGQFTGTILRATAATVAMTAALVALTYWTARQGDAAQKAQQRRGDAVKKMQNDLNEIIFTERESADSSVESLQRKANAYIKSTDAYDRVRKGARDLGVDLRKLDNIIRDTGSLAEQQRVFNQLAEAERGGSKAAGKLLDNLQDLRDSYAGVAGATKKSTAELQEFTGATKDAKKAAKELADTLGGIAQAHIDMIGALFAQREAQFSLQDAEEELRQARSAAGSQADQIAKAELDVRKARISHRQALEDQAQAEEDLLTARARGVDTLRDAEFDLANQRDSYLDSLDRISGLEEQLDELRRGPTVEELTKATNKLRDAQLNLLSANRKVSDAEWYLQYIRQQGGSKRDIADAEFALMEARQNAANEQQDLNDAEQDLVDLRDDASRQKDILKTERELASARRNSSKILRDIAESEREVRDIRAKIAGDGFYKDAQEDLVDAQIQVKESTYAVRDAELELQNIRKGSLSRDVERAQLQYERALYRVAEANTEVRKQTALMRGETFDAGDEARTLAEELGRISGNIPDKLARQRMQDFIGILSKAPAVPNPSDYEDAFNEGIGGMDLSPGIEDAMLNGFEGLDMDRIQGETFGSFDWWSLLIPGAAVLGPIIGPLLLRGLTAGATWLAGGALIGAGVLIVGGLIAAIAFAWGITSTDFGKDLQIKFQEALGGAKDWLREEGGDILQGLLDGMSAIGDTINQWVRDKFTGWVINPFKSLFGIGSPSTLFMSFGGDIMQGLLNGMVALAGLPLNFIGGIAGGVINTFSGAGNWLVGSGGNILAGLYNGLIGNDSLVRGFVNNLINKFSAGPGGWFANAFNWLTSSGSNIVIGLYNGLVSGWNTVVGWASKAGSGFLSVFNKVFSFGSPSKVFEQYGRWISEGFAKGIENSTSLIEDAAATAAGAADIGKQLQDNNLGFMLGDAGVGAFNPAAGSARVPDGQGGTTNNYGDVVTIHAKTDANPEEIVNEYIWNKRVRSRG